MVRFRLRGAAAGRSASVRKMELEQGFLHPAGQQGTAAFATGLSKFDPLDRPVRGAPRRRSYAFDDHADKSLALRMTGFDGLGQCFLEDGAGDGRPAVRGAILVFPAHFKARRSWGLISVYSTGV